MSEKLPVVDNYENIKRASEMVADEILFKNISQLIEYRKQLAVKIRMCKNETLYTHLVDLYESAQLKIKLLLAIQ